MSTTASPAIATTTGCPHQDDIERHTQSALARDRWASFTEHLASKMAIDDKIAACQAECGERSAYHGVELTPISHEEAAAMLRPHTVFTEAAEIVQDLRAGVRRVLRRTK